MSIVQMPDGRWRVFRRIEGRRVARVFATMHEALVWRRAPYGFVVWIGDGSGLPHYVVHINDDVTACGEPNRGRSWSWDYPAPNDEVCPTCRGKATER